MLGVPQSADGSELSKVRNTTRQLAGEHATYVGHMYEMKFILVASPLENHVCVATMPIN